MKLDKLAKNKSKLIILFLFLVVLISIISFFIINTKKSSNIIDDNFNTHEINEFIEVNESIEVEVGEDIPSISAYFAEGSIINENNTIKYYLNGEEIDLSTICTIKENECLTKSVSSYEVVITNGNNTYYSYLNIIDTIPPTVKTKDITINKGDSYKETDFIKSYQDNSNSNKYTVTYIDENNSKLNSKGTYNISLNVCDESNNCNEVSAKLTINENTTTTNNKTTTTENKKVTKEETNTKTFSDMKSDAIKIYSSLSNNREDILKCVNSYRKELNLNNLILDYDLNVMATIRAMEMAYTNEFSHTRPNKKSWDTLWDDYGLQKATYIGENIAKGYKTTSGVCNGWKNSETHYENMVRKEFNRMGIGKFTYNGTTYWAQEFSS